MSHSLKPSHHDSIHKYLHDTTIISVGKMILKIFPQKCNIYSPIEFIINVPFLNLL